MTKKYNNKIFNEHNILRKPQEIFKNDFQL